MNWDRKRYKNGKVWVPVDDDGNMLVNNGLTKGRYKKEDPRDYSFKADRIRNLDGTLPAQIAAHLADGPPPQGAGGSPPPPQTPSPARSTTNDAQSPVNALGPASKDFIQIYTDGATSGNPGPSGLGVVLRWGDHSREIYQYIGDATNNIAELTAIKVALEAVKTNKLPIRIYTDSKYAIGVLSGQYKARTNRQLIMQIQGIMSRFPDLQLLKVKGHAGDPLNERADELARQAITEAKAESAAAEDTSEPQSDA